MKLVDNWRQAWKWVSIHALWVAGVLPSVWESLPHRWQDIVPVNVLAIATGVTAVIGIVGRLVQQPVPPPYPVHVPDDHCQ
jgi:polyferredoxin